MNFQLDGFYDAESKVQHHVYSAFGKLLKVEDGNGADITDAPVLDPYFTFTGREFDKETGLYYYRARYYDSSTGRFLQQDPHPGEIAHPLTVTNQYVYGGNNPVMNVDPNGRFFFAALLIGAAVGGLYSGLNGGDLGDIFEGMIIGAIAGVAGAVAGGAVSAAVGPAAAAFANGSAAFGMVMGTLAGAATGATVGALAGGAAGGFINLAQGESFMDGFLNGLGIGLFAGGVTGGINGWIYAPGGAAPGGAIGSYIKGVATEFLCSNMLLPTIISKVVEGWDEKEYR